MMYINKSIQISFKGYIEKFAQFYLFTYIYQKLTGGIEITKRKHLDRLTCASLGNGCI